MDDLFFNLKSKREAANISQSEMAEFLGVSQGMISRYESDPENVPGGTIRKWNQYCGDISNAKGIIIENPRHELCERQKLIVGYTGASTLPAPLFVADRIPATPSDFIKGMHAVSKKPRIGVAGKFDAGKSRLLNTLLGGNKLPTRYQPATSIICLIRHTNEKPSWHIEDVIIYKKGFDLDRLDDESYCHDYKLVSGSYDTLEQYGTHEGVNSKAISDAYAAVVFIDSPILLAADLIDIPGYGNKVSDNKRAEVGQKLIDALLYLSPVNGFMDAFDINYLRTVLGNLPSQNYTGDRSDALRNLFMVGTHAHMVSSSDRSNILSIGARRCGSHIASTLIERYTDSITENEMLSDFERRFFTFSADDYEIRESLIKDLTGFLTEVYSRFSLLQLQSYIELSKSNASSACAYWIANLIRVLDERERAQIEIKRIKDGENERQEKKELHIKRINSLIDRCASETQMHITSAFNTHISIGAIESVIRSRYDDKKEAQQLAASYVLDKLQSDINNGIKPKAVLLGEEVDSFLDGFTPSINKDLMANIGWDFNPKVAFMSALSGIGTVGALTAWASVAAAGSNLGGYILIGQVVGWLSSIGIGLGGAGSVMAWVSAIGGPITLAIGAGILIGLLTLGIFGDSWQTKLAKKIHSEIIKQEVKKQLADGIAIYWADTKSAFIEATEKTEESYQDNLRSLEKLAFNTNPEEIKRELAYAEELRSFFAGIPWRTIQ